MVLLNLRHMPLHTLLNYSLKKKIYQSWGPSKTYIRNFPLLTIRDCETDFHQATVAVKLKSNSGVSPMTSSIVVCMIPSDLFNWI